MIEHDKESGQLYSFITIFLAKPEHTISSLDVAIYGSVPNDSSVVDQHDRRIVYRLSRASFTASS